MIDDLDFQGRSETDPRDLESLANTMKKGGLLEPILLRSKGLRYDLVAGQRRLAAAKLLGWTTIPAQIKVQTDAEAAINRLIENLQRENWNAVDQAKAFQRLTEPPYNLTAKTISELVSRPASEISRDMKLLEQPERIQDLIKRSVIRPRHARALALLEDVGERVKLATEAAEKGWTSRQIEVRARRAGKGKGAAADAIENAPAAHTPEQAAAGVVDRLIRTPPAGPQSEHPLGKMVQGIVDRLPVTIPLIRVGIGLATMAVGTSVMAAVVGSGWLRLAGEEHSFKRRAGHRGCRPPVGARSHRGRTIERYAEG